MGDFAYSVHGASGSSSGSGNGAGSLSRPGTAGGAAAAAASAGAILSNINTHSPLDMSAPLSAGPYSAGDPSNPTAIGYDPVQQQQQMAAASGSSSSNNHGTGDLWGYSAPSPPGTATAPAARSGNSVAGPSQSSSAVPHGLQQQQQQHYQSHTSGGPPPAPSAMYGYNTANTRPMTAPSASLGGPLYYHHGQAYGPMFSQSAYSGAGFPANFGGARAGPSSSHQHPQVRYATASGPGGLSGVAEDPQRPPGTAGSTADLFAHQPPPLASTSSHVAGYPQQSPYHHQQHQARPGTDYSIRREDHYRPGTSDTMRPDTAISTYSDYSTTGFGHPPGLSAAMGGSHATLHPMAMHRQPAGISHPQYHSINANAAAGHVGLANGHHPGHPTHQLQQQPQHPQYHFQQHQEAGYEEQQQQQQQSGPDKYSFVPLPSQPKKRPRRRFEEIERIYDCNYPGCNKAYGTLNHLNAHVSMQKHGPKRVPAEFKEVRKAWRQRKKESEAKAALAAQRGEGEEEEDDGQDNEGDPNYQHQQYQQDPRHGHPGHDQAGGSQTTPPGATQVQSSPSFAYPPQYHQQPQYQHHQYNGGMSGTDSSDGYYPSYAQQHHGSRPSTAPGNFLYSAYGPGSSSQPNSVNGTPVFASSSGGTSPMLGGMPAGFNPGIRKQSITSLPPAFASIQEEPAVEAAAAAASGSVGGGGGGGGGSGEDPVADVFASLDNHVGGAASGEVDGFAREVPSFDPFNHNSGSSADPTPPLEPRSLPVHSDTVFPYPQFVEPQAGSQQQQRPSTASSPFRFSTGGFAEGAFDTLGRRRKSIASPISAGGHHAPSSFVGMGEMNLVNGLAPNAANVGAGGLVVGRSDTSESPSTGLDVTGRWSPGWSNLSAYKQEIR